jgi:hypothetical protein
MNKQITLTGLLVLWKEWWLNSMIICIWLLCEFLTPYICVVKIFWGLGERECTTGVEGMAIARLDMVVHIMLIVAPVVCVILKPTQAIASSMHCPVSSASPKHGFGNCCWTQHQETAAW